MKVGQCIYLLPYAKSHMNSLKQASNYRKRTSLVQMGHLTCLYCITVIIHISPIIAAASRANDLLHVRVSKLRLDPVRQRADQTVGRWRRTGAGNCAAEDYRSKPENVPQDGAAKLAQREKGTALGMIQAGCDRVP